MNKKTTWGHVSKWYDKIVSKEGHYYHQHVIIPHSLKLLDFKSAKNPSLLDLACGQGVLSRKIPSSVEYCGIDGAKPLIELAKKHQENPKHQFFTGDITKPFKIEKKDFTHASIILALQNLEFPGKMLKNASIHLQKGGQFLIVLNHPCFRIPRQTSWQIDPQKDLQFRRVDRYLSKIKIPIQIHPGKKEKSETTYSFHYSLSDLSQFLYDSGFSITLIQEWCSNKKSTGKKAKMEDFSRNEFPLFLTILAKKN
ncbi:MAG: class I SAM-dependent methyltransferase [Simkaniaceae bacterium]|nr:class I SAM-dependent methyltransferase [Simkaniaceae bacterium]